MRHFLNQASQAPFDCQALTSSPSRRPCQPFSVAARRSANSYAALNCARLREWRASAQHRPGDPRQFIGKRDDRDVLVRSTQHGFRPVAQRIVARSDMRQRRSRAVDLCFGVEK
jgi:hypothetical protein